jgi:hypothetical protein
MPADTPAFDEAPLAHIGAEPPAELQEMPPSELMCEIGYEACEGGRMLEG